MDTSSVTVGPTSQKDKTPRKDTVVLAPALDSLLGPPALLDGEDLNDYQAFHRRILDVVQPKDIIEELWVRDLVERSWDVNRFRTWKSKILAVCAPEALESLLYLIVTSRLEREILIRGWASGDTAKIQTIKAYLKKAGLGVEAIAGRTFLSHVSEFDTIEKLLLQAERRRDEVLREIGRRRESLARQLDAATTEIDEAEFSEVAASASVLL
ncbi:MAG: hypothetical protein JWM36_1004 [Hyphomicrobiales bacterium]|nr:hypothetical protein [Hyphomicrobiales bacterium]